MTAAVRFALVGAGGIGQAYARAAMDVGEARLAAVADVRRETGEPLAKEHDVPFVADPLSLADPDRVDLALTCTPPSAHEDLVVSFLEAGVPVMCEKPLAPTTDAGRRMLAAAAATGSTLTMASKFRFVGDVVTARSMVLGGVLGEVVSAEVTFCAPVDMSQRWNSQHEVSGGGVLIDNGTHGVDILRYVLGPITSVLAAVSTSTPGIAVEDSAVVLTATDEDRHGVVSVSWVTNHATDRYLAVHGTEGSLVVGWPGSFLRLRTAAADEPFGEGYDKSRALGANLRNVARALRGAEELRVSVTDALASLAVVEAAYESARTRAWTGVEPAEELRSG